MLAAVLAGARGDGRDLLRQFLLVGVGRGVVAGVLRDLRGDLDGVQRGGVGRIGVGRQGDRGRAGEEGGGQRQHRQAARGGKAAVGSRIVRHRGLVQGGRTCGGHRRHEGRGRAGAGARGGAGGQARGEKTPTIIKRR